MVCIRKCAYDTRVWLLKRHVCLNMCVCMFVCVCLCVSVRVRGQQWEVGGGQSPFLPPLPWELFHSQSFFFLQSRQLTLVKSTSPPSLSLSNSDSSCWWSSLSPVPIPTAHIWSIWVHHTPSITRARTDGDASSGWYPGSRWRRGVCSQCPRHRWNEGSSNGGHLRWLC